MWGQGSGVGGQETFPDCLSLSSLGAQPSPAPKPVPLGNESGESPLLKCPSSVAGVKEGESGLSGLGKAFACGVFPHAPPFVSKEEPVGGVWVARWSQVGDDKAQVFPSCGPDEGPPRISHR